MGSALAGFFSSVGGLASRAGGRAKNATKEVLASARDATTSSLGSAKNATENAVKGARDATSQAADEAKGLTEIGLLLASNAVDNTLKPSSGGAAGRKLQGDAIHPGGTKGVQHRRGRSALQVWCALGFFLALSPLTIYPKPFKP